MLAVPSRLHLLAYNYPGSRMVHAPYVLMLGCNRRISCLDRPNLAVNTCCGATQDVEPVLLDLHVRARTSEAEPFGEDYMDVVLRELQAVLRTCELDSTRREVAAWLAAESGLESCTGMTQMARSNQVKHQIVIALCRMSELPQYDFLQQAASGKYSDFLM